MAVSFSVMRYLDLVTHQARDITAAIPWDIVDFQVGVDGRYLAYVVNDNGRDRLTVLDNQLKLELSPPGVPEGRITGLHFDHTGHQLAFSAESAQSPSDVYVFEPGAQPADPLDPKRTGGPSTPRPSSPPRPCSFPPGIAAGPASA